LLGKKCLDAYQEQKNYSDDKIPAIGEIKKLLEYPNRRLKSMIFTMTSSGIRLGPSIT
jgi:hypothetical protein